MDDIFDTPTEPVSDEQIREVLGIPEPDIAKEISQNFKLDDPKFMNILNEQFKMIAGDNSQLGPVSQIFENLTGILRGGETKNTCICGKPAKFQCPCKGIMYCGNECQRLDWASHKSLHTEQNQK